MTVQKKKKTLRVLVKTVVTYNHNTSHAVMNDAHNSVFVHCNEKAIIFAIMIRLVRKTNLYVFMGNCTHIVLNPKSSTEIIEVLVSSSFCHFLYLLQIYYKFSTIK